MKIELDSTFVYKLTDALTDASVLVPLANKLKTLLLSDQDPETPMPSRSVTNLTSKQRFIAAFEDLRYNRKERSAPIKRSEKAIVRLIIMDMNVWRKAFMLVHFIRTARRRFSTSPMKFSEHEGITNALLKAVKVLDHYQHNISANAVTDEHVLELDSLAKELYNQLRDFYFICNERYPDYVLRNPPINDIETVISGLPTALKPQVDKAPMQHTAMREKTPEEKERARRRAIRLGLLPKEETEDAGSNDIGDWSGDPERPLPKVQPIPGL